MVLPDAVLLGEHHDRAAFRGLVGERGHLGDLRELGLLDAWHRQELRGLAVAERDRAGLVEQQHVDVARGLDGAAGEREHVAAYEAVHARDSDRRQQGADRGRDQRDEQGDQRRDRDICVRELRERTQGYDHDEEDQRHPREQDPERYLVRGLAALGALDQRDHPVQEALAGPLGDLDDDAVGQHARAARDGRAVAAGFSDHGRRLARDGGLVDRCDPLDHGAVAGDDLAGLDDHHVAALELGCGPLAAVAQACGRLRAERAQRVRLRLAAALRERLGEVREHDREPQPERHGRR